MVVASTAVRRWWWRLVLTKEGVVCGGALVGDGGDKSVVFLLERELCAAALWSEIAVTDMWF